MIEYTLISSILDRICEMIKKIVGISKRWNQTRPLSTFSQNQNMGNIMEKGNWQNKWMGSMAMG
jgi:hypothetical protein